MFSNGLEKVSIGAEHLKIWGDPYTNLKDVIITKTREEKLIGSLRELINLDGLPVYFIDTAGLRESSDIVEQEGMKRTWEAVKKADHILLLVDSSKELNLNQHSMWQDLKREISDLKMITLVKNKIDQLEMSDLSDKT